MLDKYSKHEAIMLVGHNPSISEFLARMIAKAGCEAQVDFKKRSGHELRLSVVPRL